MYRKNNLMRNVLITADEVIFHAPTKHILDPRMIEHSIIIAEERFIRPALGTALYEDICNTKNTEVTSINIDTLRTKMGNTEIKEGDIINAFEFLTAPYISLWKQYLWKLVAECVMISALPESFVQFGSEGAMHNSPPAGLMVTSGFVTPLLSSMKWSMDRKVQDRLTPLLISLENFICVHISDYPKYPRECPDCNKENKNLKSAGIATDIYDDYEDGSCCEPGWMLKD